MRLAALLILLAGVTTSSFAQPTLAQLERFLPQFTSQPPASCERTEDHVSLRIEGFGTAWFRQFETDTAAGSARLYGGVCIEGSTGNWTVLADEAQVSGLQESEPFHARIVRAVLLVDGWEVSAYDLEANDERVILADVTFNGHRLSGSALRVEVLADGSQASAWNVALRGRNLSVDASSAVLRGDVVDMQEALITTCNCPGEPIYSVEGSAARLDLEDESLRLDGGRLQVAGLSFALAPGFELNAATMEEVALPVAVEYRPDQEDTGLALLVPELEVAPDLALEFGLLNLEGGTPTRAFGLARYDDGTASFTVGKARGGPRADFSVRQQHRDTFEAQFSVRNRVEKDWNYLHEGSFTVRMLPYVWELGRGARINLNARAFAAVSHQRIAGEPVVGPRLGTGGRAQLQAPTGPGSNLTVTVEAQATDYPVHESIQYGLSLTGQWRYSRGPLTLTTGYERLWTNEASPFTTRLDRLQPRHQVTARTALNVDFLQGGSAELQANFAYDLLDLERRNSGVIAHGGLDRLGASFGVGGTLANGWTVAFRANAELAALIDPDPKGDRDGYLQADLSGTRGELELGTRVRYDLRDAEFALLEARTAVPFHFSTGVVTPFIALNFAPTLLDGEAPAVSGHGISVTWRSCCGTVKLGYRQQNGNFVTQLGFSVEN